MFGDDLVEHGVLGVSRTIHGRDTSHGSGYSAPAPPCPGAWGRIHGLREFTIERRTSSLWAWAWSKRDTPPQAGAGRLTRPRSIPRPKARAKDDPAGSGRGRHVTSTTRSDECGAVGAQAQEASRHRGRVEQRDSAPSEVPNVAGHKGQPIDLHGGRDQHVGLGPRRARTPTAPRSRPATPAIWAVTGWITQYSARRCRTRPARRRTLPVHSRKMTRATGLPGSVANTKGRRALPRSGGAVAP
jgi:hypothetical protein